ncbi:hypothetical protein SprV_0802601400 [Sparganum proliferum]
MVNRPTSTPTYGVIKEVFGIWNGDDKATLADLEVAVTKRLKRSLDSLTKKGKKNINDTQASDPTPGSSAGRSTISTMDSPTMD